MFRIRYQWTVVIARSRHHPISWWTVHLPIFWWTVRHLLIKVTAHHHRQQDPSSDEEEGTELIFHFIFHDLIRLCNDLVDFLGQHNVVAKIVTCLNGNLMNYLPVGLSKVPERGSTGRCGVGLFFNKEKVTKVNWSYLGCISCQVRWSTIVLNCPQSFLLHWETCKVL